VPQVFFCHPPAVAVGLTADQAERAGHRSRVMASTLARRWPASAYTLTATPGRARMVVDQDRGHLLGVTPARPIRAAAACAIGVAAVGGLEASAGPASSRGIGAS
jgi:pyruvate/2-oxoglutarate dehydrogenase complex dihydrolipoamide dehydrogenase (E3) component